MTQEHHPDDATTGLITIQPSSAQIAAPQKTIFSMGPKEMVIFATEVANVLRDIIDKQKLFVVINGRKYVKVEGWCTLGTILGVFPVEDWVKEHEEGSFEAMVKLVRQSDGTVVGAASALCGSDEKTWGNRDRFARRSMAITRAAGKAYRLGFSWIMSLAGYEGTPAEEMIDTPQVVVAAEPKGYVGTPAQKLAVKEALVKEGIIDQADWIKFAYHFEGTDMTKLTDMAKAFRHHKDKDIAHVA